MKAYPINEVDFYHNGKCYLNRIKPKKTQEKKKK